MTQATRSPSEFSALTKTFERLGNDVALETNSVPAKCKIFEYGDYASTNVVVPPKHVEIGSLVAKWEKQPDRREAIARARAWVADTFHAEDGVTVRTLRMRKGLSQQQLADVIGTSQPHVARIEGGAASLQIDTCRRLARALDIDLNTLDAALVLQQTIGEKTKK